MCNLQQCSHNEAVESGITLLLQVACSLESDSLLLKQTTAKSKQGGLMRYHEAGLQAHTVKLYLF